MDKLFNAKSQAHLLSDYLQTQDLKLGHAQCLEAIAKINHAKNWNTYRASLVHEQTHTQFKTPELVQIWINYLNAKSQGIFCVSAGLGMGKTTFLHYLNNMLDTSRVIFYQTENMLQLPEYCLETTRYIQGEINIESFFRMNVHTFIIDDLHSETDFQILHKMAQTGFKIICSTTYTPEHFFTQYERYNQLQRKDSLADIKGVLVLGAEYNNKERITTTEVSLF